MADAPHPLSSPSTLLTPFAPCHHLEHGCRPCPPPPRHHLNMADTPHNTLNMTDAPASPPITLNMANAPHPPPIILNMADAPHPHNLNMADAPYPLRSP